MDEDDPAKLFWKSMQADANDGILTDWEEQPRRNHIVSMACGAFANERYWSPTWKQQFSEIVRAKGMLLGPEPWKKEEA